MPTRAGADLVPVRKETKARLAALKEGRTFDEVIGVLLESAGALPPAAAPSIQRDREPEEQVALAELAARRWREAVASGRLVEIGPRLFSYALRSPRRRTLHVEWSGRRGFSP